jgi:hypothetical protein
MGNQWLSTISQRNQIQEPIQPQRIWQQNYPVWGNPSNQVGNQVQIPPPIPPRQRPNPQIHPSNFEQMMAQNAQILQILTRLEQKL